MKTKKLLFIVIGFGLFYMFCIIADMGKYRTLIDLHRDYKRGLLDINSQRLYNKWKEELPDAVNHQIIYARSQLGPDEVKNIQKAAKFKVVPPPIPPKDQRPPKAKIKAEIEKDKREREMRSKETPAPPPIEGLEKFKVRDFIPGEEEKESVQSDHPDEFGGTRVPTLQPKVLQELEKKIKGESK